MSNFPSITLVLLPGMDGTGLLFAPFVRALPKWVKPVVVSYPPDQPLDYRGHLELVMAALPVDQPFFILGESFSGPLALMAAAQRPKGLRGVILSATFVTWPLPVPPLLARAFVALGLFRLKGTRLFLRTVLGSGASAELNELFPQVLALLKPEVLAARARAVMTVDCRVELRECHLPLLALVAERDRIIAGRCPETMQGIRPDMEVVHFDSPHLILQLATVEAVTHICRFMNRC
ncbi:MAG: alpha/beta hydrolase [Geobacteraceae bacterium]|nr:alpha/beta hydrolase [Geobacteraceae bacterium]